MIPLLGFSKASKSQISHDWIGVPPLLKCQMVGWSQAEKQVQCFFLSTLWLNCVLLLGDICKLILPIYIETHVPCLFLATINPMSLGWNHVLFWFDF